MMNVILSGSSPIRGPSMIIDIPVSKLSEHIQKTTEPKNKRIFSFTVEGEDRFDPQKKEEEKMKLFEEIAKYNKEFAYIGKYLRFKYDEETETSYVEVINAATDEVIVSLPPEFLIDLSARMKEIIGLYIDERL